MFSEDGDDRARWRPRRQWRQAAGELSFRDVQHPQSAQGSARRGPSSAPSRRPGSRTGSESRPRPGRSGAIRIGALDQRVDPENLPAEHGRERRGRRTTFAHDRQQRFRLRLSRARRDLRPRPGREDHRLRASFPATATVSGPAMPPRMLPPAKFEPVGVSFVGGSMSSPGAMEAYEHGFKKDRTMRPLYLADRPDGEDRLDLQHAAQARRPLGPRICQVLRPRSGPRRCPIRRSRRTSNSSTWAATAMPRSG